MITEGNLFNLGFKRFGDSEDDPYYKIILNPNNFNLHEISGMLTEGTFTWYSNIMNTYDKFSTLKEIFEINEFTPKEIMQKYGSNKPLK